MIIPSIKKIDDTSIISSFCDRIENLKVDDLKIYTKDKDKGLYSYYLENENNPLGFAALSYHLDEGELDYMAIDKNYEGQGFGQILLAHIDYLFMHKKIKTIFLEVRKKNKRAINLYLKENYIQYKERKDYYLNPIDDAVCMKKELISTGL